MLELIEAQKSYVKLLEEECSRLSSTSIVHSYLKASQDKIDEGIKLRADIKRLTDKLDHEYINPAE